MKFQIKKSKNGQFYFTLNGRNGQVILTSEMYVRKAGCSKAIKSLQKGIAGASVFDLSGTKLFNH